MVAMMVPSAAPMLLLFAALNRRRREQRQPAISTAVFLGGYLAVWCAFSALAAVLDAFDACGIRHTLCVGDIVGYGADGITAAAGTHTVLGDNALVDYNAAGIAIKLRNNPGDEAMHQKSAILHGRGMTVYGSSNWTASSSTSPGCRPRCSNRCCAGVRRTSTTPPTAPSLRAPARTAPPARAGRR